MAYYSILAALFAVAATLALVLYRRPAPALDSPEDFSPLKRKEQRELSKEARKEWKTLRTQWKRSRRSRRWVKIPALMFVMAAFTTFAVAGVRIIAHSNAGSDYNTQHWGVVVAIAVVIATAILMRWPLKLKSGWLSISLLVFSVVVLAANGFFAGASFITTAEAMVLEPAEKDEAKENQPTVQILSELDKTCPSEYIIPSEMVDGGPVPNRAAISQFTGSDEIVSARNPDLLLKKIQQKIDNPDFVKELQESSQKELADGFKQEDFDSFVTGLKAKTTKSEDLVVQYGNGLCPTPYAKAAHITRYGW